MTETISTKLHQQTLGDLLRRTARRVPQRVAIQCGDTRWTYEDFDRICNRLAHGLAAQGVRLGDRVAILSRNSHAFVAMRFALARLGAVLVPVNTMLNDGEITFILKSSGTRMLAIGSDYVDVGGRAAAEAGVEQVIWLPGEEPAAPPAKMTTFDELLSDLATAPSLELDSRMLAQIVYTSGTESLPKGAMLTHEAIIWEYVSCIIDGEMSPQDKFLHALPLYHCAQLDCFLGPAIYLGMQNIITAQPRPEVLLPLIAKHQISSFFAPPTVWISLLRSPLFDGTDTSSLQKGYYGASIMPVEVLREMQRRIPRLRLWNFYGQTEIAPVATILKPEDQERKPGSAGWPVLNVETRVVNDAMEDVAVGEVGEIIHRSPQLLTGYFNDPVKTKEAFAGGWFHSGDLATVDTEGYISVVDRKKDMIKTGGENVASREVEETIFELAQVSEVAVIGLPDPRWIEAVTAVIVLRSGEKLDDRAVIEHCRKNLAAFKIPRRVIFVEELPKSPSGKLLKKDLRLRYQ